MTRLAIEDVELRQGGFRLRTGRLGFRAGRVTVLLGANGSGKSTLLRVAAGIVRPDAGHAALDGRPVHALRPRDRAAGVSLVVQHPQLAAPFTVREAVQLGRVARGRDDAAVERALEQVNAAQQKAKGLREAYETGEPVPLTDVVIQMQKASLAFEATLQVRNKVMKAYEDILNMPV